MIESEVELWWAKLPADSTANPGGSALDTAGSIAISGTSTFSGGYLGGDAATLLVTEDIVPHP